MYPPYELIDDNFQAEVYKLAMPYNEFDVLIPDIDNKELVKIGLSNEIEHLSPATFQYPAFPVTGTITGLNNRYMVPLVCQQGDKPDSKAVFVWFLVDTSSPFTCLSVKSLESIFGEGCVTHSSFYVTIQDQERSFTCQVSKDGFAEVNILGADVMQRLELSILVDWKKNEFQLVEQ